MLRGTYFTRLRVDGGHPRTQELGCWEGRGGVGSGLGGGAGRFAQKNNGRGPSCKVRRRKNKRGGQ